MPLEISVLGWLGLVLAAPAIFVGSRVAIRSLLGLLMPKSTISILYTDSENNTHKAKIHVDSDDELLKLIDEIADKRKRERRGSTSHA